jgi:HAD superfamily hydrolase (TIGR01509 family)
MFTPQLLKVLTGKHLLIFDFDGTIADTSPLHAEAFTDILTPLGLSVDYSQIAGMSTLEALCRCFDLVGLDRPSPNDLQALVSKKQKRVQELIQISLEPFPMMHTFLCWAKSRYAMALVTSGSHATVSLALDRLGYKSLFQTMIFAEDVKAGKPDPEGFLIALKAHLCDARHALVFEDSEAGFRAAVRANIAFVDVNKINLVPPPVSGKMSPL